MPKAWLDLLNLELEEISLEELIAPEAELDEERDHPVGELDDDLKKLFTKWQQLKETADRTYVDARYARDEEKRAVLVARTYELQEKAEITEKIFWTSVKDSFNLWDKSIGIRKGWIVVVLDETFSPQEMLRNIFGGGPT